MKSTFFFPLICSCPGCLKSATRGFCDSHWTGSGKFRKPGPSMPMEERFWRWINRKGDNDCWLWLGNIGMVDGYGRFNVLGKRPGKIEVAHRVAYKLLIGEIPEDLTLDHLCYNRACVNPNHLEPVSRSENTKRMGRHYRETHSTCSNGHEWTLQNTYLRPSGARQCKKCNAIAAARKRLPI